MSDSDLVQPNNLPVIGEYPWVTTEAQALLDLTRELIAKVERLEAAAAQPVIAIEPSPGHTFGLGVPLITANPITDPERHRAECAEQRLAALRADYKVAIREVDALQAEVKQLQAQNKNWQRSLVACNNNYRDLEAENTDRHKRLEQLEALLTTEQHLTVVLTKDSMSLREEKDKSDAMCEQMRGELQVLEAWQRGNIAAVARSLKQPECPVCLDQAVKRLTEIEGDSDA